MSETAIMAMDGQALPAHLQGKQSGAAGGLVVASDSLPKISAKDAQFILRDGDKELKLPIGESISIVILGADPAEGLAKAYNGQFTLVRVNVDESIRASQRNPGAWARSASKSGPTAKLNRRREVAPKTKTARNCPLVRHWSNRSFRRVADSCIIS